MTRAPYTSAALLNLSARRRRCNTVGRILWSAADFFAISIARLRAAAIANFARSSRAAALRTFVRAAKSRSLVILFKSAPDGRLVARRPPCDDDQILLLIDAMSWQCAQFAQHTSIEGPPLTQGSPPDRLPRAS